MGYTWDVEKRRYRDEHDNTVAPSRVRQWADSLTAALALFFALRAQRVVDKQLSFTAWDAEMRADITSLHYAEAALAYGGVLQAQSPEWGAAERVIATQQSFFANFAAAAASGAIAVSAGFVARSALYALAGYATYENSVVAREFDSSSVNLYRRVLDVSAENCEDCKAYARLGWQTRAQLPEIGDSICRVRCRCHYVFKTGALSDIGTTN